MKNYIMICLKVHIKKMKKEFITIRLISKVMINKIIDKIIIKIFKIKIIIETLEKHLKKKIKRILMIIKGMKNFIIKI
jgi:hypothetical protein